MRIALTIGFTLAFLISKGQGNLFSFTDITIRSGSIYMNGNWTHGDSTTSDKVYSAGQITIKGDLINFSNTELFGSDSTGTVVFIGNLQNILGDSSIKFNDVLVNSTGNIYMRQNSYVVGNMHLNSGRWNLYGNTLHLSDKGHLHNESNTAHIYGASGHVAYRDPALTGPSALNVQGCGLVLQAPQINFGTTTLERHHSSISNVANSSIARSYRWTSMFSGNATNIIFNYLDAWELIGLQEHELALYRSNDGGSTWRKIPSILDTAQNNVLALNVDLDTCWLALANANCTNPPVFNIADTIWACEGDSALVTTGSTDFHDWSFGANSDSVYVANNGIFWVTVFDSSGCETTDTFTVVIDSIPTASFSSSLACEGDTTFFTNTSTYWNSSPSYFWDFGDTLDLADTSQLTSPRHPYQNPGVWHAQLIVSGISGCQDTTTAPITVFNAPEAGFTSTNYCLGGTTMFNDTSRITVGAISQYQWQFGDTNTSAILSPGHVYSDTGTYVVQLKVTSNAGCVDSTFRQISIQPLPNLTFSPTQVCALDSITFSYGGDSLSTIKWKFNVTDSSNVFSPKYAYLNPGLFSLVLQGISPAGCSDTIHRIVTVDSIPSKPWNSGSTVTCGSSLPLDCGVPGAIYGWSNSDTTQQTLVTTNGWSSVNIQFTNGCQVTDSIQVTLNAPFKPDLGPDTSVCGSFVLDAGSPGSTYLWSDNDSSRFKTVTQSGIYIVKVTDPNACVGSDTIQVSITSLPGSFLPPDTVICDDSLVTIVATGIWNAYNWSTGDTIKSMVISQSGLYHCTVTDTNKCLGMDSIQVQFGIVPQLRYDKTIQLCGKQDVLLVADTTLASWVWSKNSTVLSTTNSAQLSDTGIYTLIQTDHVGCTYVDSLVLAEDEFGIEANFLVNTQTTTGDTLQFVNVSATRNGTIKYYWAFADGTLDTVVHPTHIYYLTGVFNASLRVNNEHCVDSVSKQISIVSQKRDDTPEPEPEPKIYSQRFDEVLVWPNPNFGEFNLKISTTGIGAFEILLFDQSGQLISQHPVSELGITSRMVIENPSAGMYFLAAKASEVMKTVKIIVVK